VPPPQPAGTEPAAKSDFVAAVSVSGGKRIGTHTYDIFKNKSLYITAPLSKQTNKKKWPYI